MSYKVKIIISALAVQVCMLLHAKQQTSQPASFLRVTVTPPEAVVMIDGIPLPSSSTTITNIPAGTHVVKASLAGYSDLQHSVTITPGQRLVLQLQMERLSGLLLIHSSPQGADIRINGMDRGKTPCFITDLPLGKYTISFNKTGYLQKQFEVEITDRIPRKISVDLTSDSAVLVLDSIPSGANVTINGISKGSTPCRIENVPAGENKLEISLNGYDTYVSTLKLNPGEIQQLTAKLNARPSSLRIVSIPEKARIYIDNQFEGEAPVEKKDLKPGSYRIRAELPGYELMARTIEIKQASSIVEEFRLQSNSGALQITTEPAGVQVFIDGQERGITTARNDQTDKISEPLKIPLIPAGTYELKLEKKGYVPVTEKITIEHDKTTTITKSLVRRFIPDVEIRTENEVIRGMLIEVNPRRYVRVEVKPGIIRTIPESEIRVRSPIKETPEKKNETAE